MQRTASWQQRVRIRKNRTRYIYIYISNLNWHDKCMYVRMYVTSDATLAYWWASYLSFTDHELTFPFLSDPKKLYLFYIAPPSRLNS